jgi:cold shock CspA family protein
MALRGIVTTFDPKLRYGWVLGEVSVDYVHTADVEGPRLVAGCRVQFNPGWARGRPRALEVRRLEEGGA